MSKDMEQKHPNKDSSNGTILMMLDDEQRFKSRNETILEMLIDDGQNNLNSRNDKISNEIIEEARDLSLFRQMLNNAENNRIKRSPKKPTPKPKPKPKPTPKPKPGNICDLPVINEKNPEKCWKEMKCSPKTCHWSYNKE